MKKPAIIISIFLFSYAAAQKMTFFYELNYKNNSESSTLNKVNYVLDVDNEESVFRTEIEKKSDSMKSINGMGLGVRNTLEGQLYIYKNRQKREVLKKTELILRNTYSITIDEKLNWKISNDTDKIGNYLVQKAEVNYGGRNWTAWFSAEIPINEGPYVFHELPGLIISIYDEKKEYVFMLTGSKKNSEKLYYKKGGIKLNWAQYQKICRDYYSNPFGELIMQDTPIRIDDGRGNTVKPDIKEITIREQKRIRDNNNPIELNYKIDYK